MTVDRFPVEATHILMFARAINDPNPAYTDPDSDAARANGVIAPPTFAAASSQFDPDNHLRPKPDQPWFGSGRTPSGAHVEPSGRLHAEQHYEYHRPLVAGMTLTATFREGATWEKQSARAGTLLFTEGITDYHDVATGELIVTARGVSVKTERPVDKEA